MSTNKIKVLAPQYAIIDDNKHLITVNPGDKLKFTLANIAGMTKEDLKEIRWIVSNFHGAPNSTKISKKYKGEILSVTFQKGLAGGGLVWVEPVLKGQQPKHTPPYGYFVNAKGPKSIDRIEWRDAKGELIKENNVQFFTESVQLHVYTTGLYGHDINVLLKDIKDRDYDLYLDEDVTDDSNEFGEFFSREVKYYNKDGKQAQKVIIHIRLEARWRYAGKNLKIIPIVSSKIQGLKKPSFKNNYITVKTHDGSEYRTLEKATKTGNKPTIIGNIFTDTADFKPCFFTKIEAVYFKGDEETNATLFDDTNSLKPEVMAMAVVAGPRHARRIVKLKLDIDLNYCHFIGNDKLKHESRVFDFSKIEEAIIVSSSKKDKGYRLTGKKDKFSIMNLDFEQEDGDHGDNNDNGEMQEDNVYFKMSLDSIIGGVGGHTKSAWNGTTNTYVKVPESDSKVTIEVPFKYGATYNNENITDLVKYIWPAKAIPQTYPIYVHTCRYPNHLINIDVYPDVKWTLQFCYNTDPAKFNEIRSKYKDYQVRLEEVDAEAKETYDDKIERNKDLADTYSKLSKEIKVNTNKIAKKIKKQKQKLENANGTEKKKAKNKLRELEKQKKSLNKQQEKYKNRVNNYERKVDENKADKKKYKKKGKKKAGKDTQHSKHRPDLYNFEDNLEHGISDIKLALWAEWDRPAEKFELTAGYQKYMELLKTILRFKKMVDEIFGGKKNKDQTKKRLKEKAKKEKATEKLKSLLLLKAIKPKSFGSVNIIPPSIAIAGSWYAENPKSTLQNEIGTNLELQAIFDPIVGAEIVLNFMALVEKSHPLVKVALIVMEVGGFEIRLDLTVTGTVFAKGFLQYNTTSGKGNISPGDIKDLKDAEDDAPMEVGGTITMEVYAGIKYTKKYEAWGYDVIIYLGAYVSVVTGITISGFVEWIKD
ncbi:MAG: hypothetical protein JKY08_07870, partial [Flavobacteriaceae bacterium]|nr:hypothetical protein [Flavobacteriaceae bacterium]